MTLHQLKVFLQVARQRSFSQAAKSLFISQPSVSYQVQELERELRVELFSQAGRRISLTQAGHILHDYAQQVEQLLDDAVLAMQELRGLEGGTLRVGASTTAGIYVLPEILGAFKHAHPKIEVRLEIGNWQQVQSRLLDSQLDLVVAGEPSQQPRLAVEPLMPNELVVVAAPDHPLAGQRAIPLERLAEESFIIREVGSGTRSTVERLLAERGGITLTIAMELGSNGAIKQAVAAGMGVAILSRPALTLELETERLVVLDVEGFPVHRTWNIVYMRTGHLSIPAVAFRQFLREWATAPRVEAPKRPRPASVSG
jgi:DNA-binding transcriptional LysR family regulator